MDQKNIYSLTVSIFDYRMGVTRKFSRGGGGGGGGLTTFLSHQCGSQRAERTSLGEQLDPKFQGKIGPKGLRGSVPDLLRKPIATCGFLWGGGSFKWQTK